MLSALKSYLEQQGYKNIYCDYMPDQNQQLQAISLVKWQHTVGSINDGTGAHYIQIQCRAPTYAEAHHTCAEFFKLLDSGTDEQVINLTGDIFCIARPRRGPILLERGEGYATFYCEIALWGSN